MSRRVFAVIGRGMTDKTAVCVYPWELPILALIHGDAVEEKTIDELCDLKGPVKVEKQKLKHAKVQPPGLREQYEIMAYVDPEEDPANDPGTEYDRMVGKYGMDKEFPMPVVERIFGQFSTGNFERLLKEHLDDRQEKPSALKARDEGLGKSPEQMTVGELREALNERGIEWTVKDNKAALVAKLEEVLVT